MPVTRRQLLVSLFGLIGVTMPISNGQVGSRDIRQAAVKTLHVSDDAITTPKIEDLAVTFPDKIDAPTHIAVFESNPGLGATLTDIPQELASITVDIPTWVGQIFVLASGYVQGDNDDGTERRLFASVQINDNFDGAGFTSVPNGNWGQAIHFEETALTQAGSTIQVSIYGWLSGGTFGNSLAAVWGVVLGQR